MRTPEGTGRRAAALSAWAGVAAVALALPAGAEGQFGVQFMRYVGASADGERVFIETLAQLVPADNDEKADIYERAGGKTTLVTPGTAKDSFAGLFRRASADGTRVFFNSDEPLVPADTDEALDVYERSGGTTMLVSAGEINGNGAFAARFQDASADGTHVFFTTDEQLVTADLDMQTDVYERSSGTTKLVTVGEIDGPGDPAPMFLKASADGARFFFTTAEQLLAADTDAFDDVYERSGGTTTLLSPGTASGHDSFSAASADGTRVFFSTNEPLVAADTDSSSDIYERSGGTTTPISAGEINGNGPFIPVLARVSEDGTRVLFGTAEQLVAADMDGRQDIYERFAGTTTLVSETTGDADFNDDTFIAGASADATRVFFHTAEMLVPADTDSSNDVYEHSGGTTALVSAGEINGNGAFPAFTSPTGSSADGTRVYFSTFEQLVAADTDSSSDVYERSGGMTTLVSAGEINGNGAFSASYGGASADGTRVFFFTDEQLVSADLDIGETGIRDVYERSGGQTRLVSIEMIPPETTISDDLRRPNHDRTPTFELSSSEEGSQFRCRVDRRRFRPCGATKTLRRLRRFGRHVLRARATDPAGNEDPTAAKRVFRVVKR